MGFRAAATVCLAAALAAGCTFDTADGSTADVDLSWELSQRGVPVSCQHVGAERVRVDFDPGLGDPRFVSWFPCTDMAGTARYLPVGEYMTSLVLLDADGEPVEHGPAVPVFVEAPWSASSLRVELGVSPERTPSL